jgi:hypothetical protein
MPTKWIHSDTTAACPCGAPTEDQVRRPDGADRANWFCLTCEQRRPPDPGWVDELVPITEEQWLAQPCDGGARALAVAIAATRQGANVIQYSACGRCYSWRRVSPGAPT